MSEPRMINVEFWIEVLGERQYKLVRVSSPLLSNQPCPNIQADRDKMMAECAVALIKSEIKTGYEIT